MLFQDTFGQGTSIYNPNDWAQIFDNLLRPERVINVTNYRGGDVELRKTKRTNKAASRLQAAVRRRARQTTPAAGS